MFAPCRIFELPNPLLQSWVLASYSQCQAMSLKGPSGELDQNLKPLSQSISSPIRQALQTDCASKVISHLAASDWLAASTCPPSLQALLSVGRVRHYGPTGQGLYLVMDYCCIAVIGLFHFVVVVFQCGRSVCFLVQIDSACYRCSTSIIASCCSHPDS